ncbi:cytochrome c551 peroxidase (plasmid) [Methylocystis bryophila]|uniref:Cytochrome-c peroxidase n=2 Tax=Methylocystis bryophila TaxID=655015 RepID=A0A1W6N2B4_9HYPH|nr:cytochrome c peroxidase [Methylocystis bryophila]ARN83982.1 cytochrome-c peroxidase [Methylocystis bryophila]BDV41020.1 cytochrome c551 peroxidase [Methylocystis bryophila]
MALAVAAWACGAAEPCAAEPLGLPPVPIPADNPQSPEKIALGSKLFHDKHFSADGTISCSTCHDDAKAFTDSPLKTSRGIRGQFGQRNAPTVVNAAYYQTLFWDGRTYSLEDQSRIPPFNPIEMGLTSYDPFLDYLRADNAYAAAFKKVFDVHGEEITIEHVKKAIASFERTLISGDSPFDRWRFAHETDAISKAAQRGFEVFVGQGRCVSCHVIEQDNAIFTDNRFHNTGVGINKIQAEVPRFVDEFQRPRATVHKAVLHDPMVLELGRIAIRGAHFDDIGAFKTPTLRNIAVTAPYMHDGSLKTLKDVVKHYNDGGRSPSDPSVNPYLSSGIRPLYLSDQQQDDLVAFLETLTSPAYAGVKTEIAEQASRPTDERPPARGAAY